MTSGSVAFTSCKIGGTGTFRFIATSNSGSIQAGVSNSFLVTQTLGSINITKPSGTILPGVSFSVTVSLLDTNGLNFLNTNLAAITLVSSGTTMATISSLVVPVTAQITFPAFGTQTLSGSCSGTNCGSYTSPGTSIIVSKNAYINIEWTQHITEASTGSYQIALIGIVPTQDVQVSMTSTSVTISPASVTFNAGSATNIYQTVSITLPYLGGTSHSVSIAITHAVITTDTNYAAATFTGCGVSTSGELTIPIYTTTPTISVDSQVSVVYPNSVSYQISINLLPKASTVTVSTSFTSAYLTLSTSSVTFTAAGPLSKSITITSIKSITTISQVFTITYTIVASDTLYASYSQSPSPLQTTVTLITSSFAGVRFTNSYLNIGYQESGTYTLQLKTAPSSSVTISVTSSLSSISLTTSSFTFTSTNYNVPQTITATVSSIPTSVSNFYYPVTMIHTLTSSDSNYNGLIYDTIINVINVCTPGVYQWTSTNVCTGSISGFVTSTNSIVPCAIGQYYLISSCITCPVGKYCPDGINAYACLSGYYTLTTGQTYCTKSSPGYLYSSSSTSPTAVSSGSYALPGSTSSQLCSAGDYCPYTTLNVEYKCPLGSYSSSSGSTSCTTCAEGNSCTYTATATCASGTYSPSGSGQCYICNNVFETCTYSSVALVTEGYKISSGTITACASNEICSIANNYQSSSSCPPGTYYSSSSCVTCVGNYKCDGTTTSAGACSSNPSTFYWGVVCLNCPYPSSGSTSCTIVSAGSSSSAACAAYSFGPGGYQHCLKCSPGYLCTSSSQTPTTDPCSLGSVCPPSATTSKCPAGTYSDIAALMHQSQCMICIGGYICASTGISVYPPGLKCLASYFCPYGNTASSGSLCLGGAYSTGTEAIPASTNAECSACALGYYCQKGVKTNSGSGYYSDDLMSLSICPFGTSLLASGSGNVKICITCTGNRYCPAGSPLPTLCLQGWSNAYPGSQLCTRCPDGSACPGANIVTPISCSQGYFCPLGTYSEKQYSMNAGFYIGSNAVSEKDATECDIGYACLAGSAVQNTVCPIGFFCLSGTPMVYYFACPPGTYNTATTGTSPASCTACPAGSSCMTGSSAVSPCGQGFYCPAGTQRANQFPCLSGTYSVSTSLDSAAACTACDSGYYCPGGTNKEYSCPPGTYLGTGGTSASSCIACTAGKYCGTPNTVTPTDCGAGYYCNTGATAPLICTIGYYCSSTTTTSSTAVQCSAGYLCPYGVGVVPTAGSAYACVAGYYCLVQALFVIPCPPGTYRSSTGGTSISDCSVTPPGYYLDTYAATTSGTVCMAGYYCPSGTTQPIPCPIGTYNPSTQKSALSDCLACPAGLYCPNVATSAGNPCPKGSYCVAGVSTPTFCPVGTYAPNTNTVSLAACTNCDAGKYCDTPGLVAVSGSCSAGYICYSASITATPVGQTYGDLCPAGSYCPAGTATVVSCPSGTFNNYQGQSDSSGCIICPVGFYCASAVLPYPSGPCDPGYFCGTQQTTATPAAGAAQAGYFAPGGTPAQIPCLIGTYQDQTAQSSCKACPAGSYCPSAGMSSPTACPSGNYCPLGSTYYMPCVPGTFRATTGGTALTDCTPCSAGSYCGNYGLSSVSGNCAAGYFCEIGSPYQYPSTLVDVAASFTQYGPCPLGYYCPAGTTSRSANACPAGTYNPANLGMDSNACLKCTAGRYCTGTANTNDNSICPTNYYCPEGTTTGTSNPCTAGHFCAQGSDYEKPCFPGTYSSAGSQSSCTNCPAGSYCVRGSSSYTTCPIGYYCPLSTVYANQYPCPPGTYNPSTGKVQSSDCVACDAGKYCDVYGIGSVTSLICSAGFYCSGNAIVSKPMTGSTYGGSCARGQFCPAGSSSATSCTAGSYCSKSQLSAVSGSCTQGHYCTLSATAPAPTSKISSFSFGDVCPKGSYCPTGTSVPTACPIGKYMPYTGAVASADCIDCPPGYYCPNSGTTDTTIVVCTAGYICASGVSDPTTYPCPAGSYCPAGSWQSILCAAGTYQANTAQSSCTNCPAGSYCEIGATSPTTCPAGYYCQVNTGYRYTYPCPIGTYNPSTGKSAQTDCINCDAGKYCLDVGLTAVSGSCSAGYYCTTGAVVPNPPNSDPSGSVCPQGTFCVSGSSTATSCTAGSYCLTQGIGVVSGACSPGYYCNSGSTTPVPVNGVMGNICSQGNYCPSGSSTQTGCTSGTYGAGIGLTAQGDCTSCPYGYYCGTSGLSSPTGPCSSGYYCIGGQTSSTPTGATCNTGSYCPAGSFESIPCGVGTYQSSTGQSSCLTCPPGLVCGQGTITGTACGVGYYCPAGTGIATQYPCPAGSYSDVASLSACKTCPAGSVCGAGATNTNTVCPQYYYCPAGTATALLCPLGTYNSASLSLTSSSSCTSCPAGSYCVDGRVSAQCEAGYWCEGGSPTPTPIGSNAYGTQCPAGSYCPAQTITPTSCPVGKFNKLVGGSSINDCTDCPPGYYCTPGVSTPFNCPKGYWCAQAVSTPTACPMYYYNPLTTQETQNSCIVCPAGYLCSSTGISDYTLYPCNSIGAYCVAGAKSPTLCPPGTYGISKTAASISDCLSCPGGYQCPGRSNSVIGCPEGTYCPEGSAIPKLCTIGSYCQPLSSAPKICPAGFYCPKYDYENLPNYVSHPNLYYNTTHDNGAYHKACPTGYVCPEGSWAPTFCQPGYYADSTTSTCVGCGVGTYANDTSGCKVCDSGYICVFAANRPDPTDTSTEGGYICPAGYYCPAGASTPIPCGLGYFNPSQGSSSNNSCLPCPSNTYSDAYGSSGCNPCGPYAQSILGNTTCTCLGLNRKYLKTDGTCRCAPQYTFRNTLGEYQPNKDGSDNCYPIVYKFADKGVSRNPSGDPVKSSGYCDKICAKYTPTGGSVNPNTGLCICTGTKSIENYANLGVRTSSQKFTMSNGQISVSGTSKKCNFNSNNQYFGRTVNSNGNLYSVDMQPDGPVAYYGPNSALASQCGLSRRQLSSSVGIPDPVACININDTYLFSVTATNYPVYDKDSLLNNNPNFDYGAFEQLADLMKSGSTTTVFAFTFTEQGIYDITDSSDSDQHIIISVMGTSQQCPDPTIPIQTRTESSVLTLGTQLNNNIIADPNWLFIGGILFWFVFLSIFIILGIYYFEKSPWDYFFPVQQDYRSRQMDLNAEDLTKPENESSSFEDIDKDKNRKDEKNDKKQEVGLEDLMGNDDLDPNIFQSMLKLLKEQDMLAKTTFNQRSEDGLENLKSILEKINKLKRYLRESLAGLDDRENDSDSEHEIQISPQQEIENAIAALSDNFARDGSRFDDAKKKLVDILNDPTLSEKDKKDLLDDFNANMDRIDQALGEEQKKAQEILNKRLLERQKRKKNKENPEISEESKENQLKTIIQPNLPEINLENLEQHKQEIEKNLEKEKSDIIKKMRQELNINLKETKDLKEKEALMEDYNKKAKELELKIQIEKEKQEADLLKRLKARKAKPQSIDILPEDPVLGPTFFQIEDQEKIELIQEKHEEERQILYEQQEAEKIKVLNEIESIDIPIPKLEEKQQLEEALKNASNDIERQKLLNQLNFVNQKLSSSALTQQNQLEAKLLERKRLRAIKEAELKNKHLEEQKKLDDKEDEEIAALTDDITKKRIEEILVSDSPPEEIVKKIKEMIDEKHEIELNQLTSKKQEVLAERQTYLLQESLGIKAVEIQKTRKDFFNKRLEVEVSAMHPKSKILELQELEKKEAEQMTQIDYDFINNLSKAQDNMWRTLEEDFRQKFLDLADKHLTETGEILKKMQAMNPALLKIHLKQAEDEAETLKKQVESDYKNKVKELDTRQREIDSLQNEKEREIEDLKRQLDEAEAKKKEMYQVEQMRKEMEEKQRQMIEEMRRRGIKPEQMEEMIKKHQQEMSEWEATMEKERIRQKERMQEKLNARLAKQDRMSMKIARYKEENLKIIQNKEEEKLEIGLKIDRPELLYEPIKDIESRLRVNPLPIFSRNPVAEYADYSMLLQSLLVRVKKIERTVASVDLDQFEIIMKQLESISSSIKKTKIRQ